MRNSHLLALGGLLVAALALPTRVHAQDAAALFKTKCEKCHGAGGKGDGAAGKTLKLTVPDMTDAKRMAEFNDAKLEEIITKGEKKMPKYDTLTPEQVKGLVAYVKAFAKK